jgi:hypothetical protein
MSTWVDVTGLIHVGASELPTVRKSTDDRRVSGENFRVQIAPLPPAGSWVCLIALSSLVVLYRQSAGGVMPELSMEERDQIRLESNTARRREIDSVLVWRLDRWDGRSWIW